MAADRMNERVCNIPTIQPINLNVNQNVIDSLPQRRQIRMCGEMVGDQTAVLY